MEARFEERKRELLDECKVAPQVLDRVLPRLETFMAPFVASLVRREQIEHTQTFVQGLLSDLEHKNVESIAYHFGQDRMPLQWFVGTSDWDPSPLRDELVSQVGKTLGDEDGVIVFDPSGFPKSGRDSVGAARQWCGRLGKVDNCQVAVYMGYASRHEHALVDTRLYLSKEWTKEEQRRKKAGVPPGIRYQTRHQLCLEMLKENGEKLPHSWISGDDEMGRPYWFRRRLNRLNERYLLAVPSNTLIRDLEADPPPYSGHGRKPKRPWTRVDKWIASQSDDQGSLNYHAVPFNMKQLDRFVRLVARHWLFVLRRRSQRGARRWNWERMDRLVHRYLPRPRILHPYPHQRFRARLKVGAV